MCFLEFALDEWVHHVAGTPDAQAYANLAVIFCCEGVTTLGIGYYVHMFVVTFLMWESFTESYHAGGCSDIYPLPIELLHGILG